jgi:dipeptidyl aminopeptidase/acylaminoacyl peptidase
MSDRRKALDLESLIKLDFPGSIAFNGRDVVFQRRDAGGINQLFALDLESRKVRQLTFSDFSVWGCTFSPDGRTLLTYADINGNERFRIFSLPSYPEPGDLVPIVDNGKFNYWAVFSPDSRKIAYSSGEPWSGNIAVKDLETGKERVYEGTMPVVLRPRWSPDGKKIAFLKGMPPGWKLMVLDVDSGDLEEILGTGGWVTLLQWSKHGILVSDNLEEWMQLRLWNGEWNDLTNSPWDKGNASVGMGDAGFSDSGRLAYGENREGRVALILKEASGEEILIMDEGINTNLIWHGETLVFLHNSSVSCGEVWMYDANTRRKEKLIDFMPAEIDRTSFVSPKIVHYRSFDGREISGLLYIPKNFVEDRAIVLPHGGPTAESADGWSPLSPLIQYIVSCGFAVFEPNYRGSTGFGRTFLELNIGDIGGGDLEDIVYACKYLEDNWVSKGRVAIAGVSYGGYLTLAALTMRPEVFACGVGISVVFDWVTEYKHSSPQIKEYFEKRFMGNPEEDSLAEKLAKERSPITHIKNISRPVMIVQGGQDPRTPVYEALSAAQHLSEAGKPYKLLIYGDEGHFPAKLHNRLEMFRLMVDFLNTHLPAK